MMVCYPIYIREVCDIMPRSCSPDDADDTCSPLLYNGDCDSMRVEFPLLALIDKTHHHRVLLLQSTGITF